MFFIQNHTLYGYRLYGNYGAFDYVFGNFWLEINVHNIYPILENYKYKSLNGSLWTLRFEFYCYILTFILGISRVLNKKALTIALFILVSLVSGINSK